MLSNKKIIFPSDYKFTNDYNHASLIRNLFFPKKTIKQVMKDIKKTKNASNILCTYDETIIIF
jgi:hypothetical protein